MQKWDIRPLTTPKPLNRSSPKVAYVITSRISTDVHNLVTISQAVSFLRMREILLFLVPRSAWTVYGLVTNCLHLVLPSVTDAASLRYLPHHFNMSSIYLRAGRLGRRSPSTIPNNNAFNSRSSSILQICPTSWSFLIWIVSTTVSFRCTTARISSLVLQCCHFTAEIRP